MTTIVERWTRRRRNGETLLPLGARFPVTTPFGIPGNWQAGHHPGADYAAPTGTPIRATHPGKVVALSPWGADYGIHPVIEFKRSDGIVFRVAYCHMSRCAVRVGQDVKPGTFLGRVGETGRATGPHLHQEARTAPFRYANHDVSPMNVNRRP